MMKRSEKFHLAVAFAVLAGRASGAVDEHSHPHPGSAPLAQRLVDNAIVEQLDIGLLVEVEGFASRAGGVNESDIVLATVELLADAVVAEHISAHLAGLGNRWLDLNAGAFNGDFEGDGEENTIDDFFASVSCTPCEFAVFGAYLLSDLLETDGFEDFVNGAFPGGAGYEDVVAAGVYMNLQLGAVVLNLEYAGAVQKLETPAGELRPMAYNAEASMPVHDKVTVGIKLEGSDDFYADYGTAPIGKWADWQTGIVVSYTLNPHVILSGEFLHAEGLEGDEEGDTATMQVAFVL